MSSSRSSSSSPSIASCSCSRHRLRSWWFVDQSVSSKERRAASIARFMSAFDASATSPRTSSFAGLMLVNVPASPSTSLPSIIILRLERDLRSVRHRCSLSCCGGCLAAGENRIASDANRCRTGCGSTLAANTIARCAVVSGYGPAAHRALPRNAHHQPGHVVHSRGRQQSGWTPTASTHRVRRRDGGTAPLSSSALTKPSANLLR